MAQAFRNFSKRIFKYKNALIITAMSSSGLVIAASLATPVFATNLEMHPPSLPWYHRHKFHSYDHKSLRRGYQVYKEVCSACHSLKFVAYRHLVNTILTEEEAKSDAAEQLYTDGPNDDGEMFQRPGVLTDYFPNPYENEIQARNANNGALPPDLSYIVTSSHGEEDYVFHILTGYCEAPPGRTIAEGQYYHPYFKGGAIGMKQALYNEQIEYLDGTEATVSQMAKDVTQFLRWASDPHLDTRNRYFLKVFFYLGILIPAVVYWKRRTWAPLKTMKIAYKNRPTPKNF